MRAEYSGLKRTLHIGLNLAHDLLGSALPSRISNEIEDDVSAKRTAAEVFEKLFSDAEGKEGIIKEYLFWAKTRERLRDQAKYLISLGTEPAIAEFNAVPMPACGYPLYRIIRPARLFNKYILKRD